jgi:hypothetical protein
MVHPRDSTIDGELAFPFGRFTSFGNRFLYYD